MTRWIDVNQARRQRRSRHSKSSLRPRVTRSSRWSNRSLRVTQQRKRLIGKPTIVAFARSGGAPGQLAAMPTREQSADRNRSMQSQKTHYRYVVEQGGCAAGDRDAGRCDAPGVANLRESCPLSASPDPSCSRSTIQSNQRAISAHQPQFYATYFFDILEHEITIHGLTC